VDEEDPLVETVVADRYRVLRKIGEGGMSVVYEVQHTKLARAFALKRLLPSLLRNQEALQRFEREAELLASLRHPNVVDISDWVQLPDGSPCMILEFLHGASLSVRLLRQPLEWETIARMADQAMSALQLAHRMGIIHRDLKPDNIFISIDDVGEERVKILDFGVSKLTGSTRLSGVHEIVGTPAYMSPEQAQGITDEIGPKSDVWAMGAILFEMATQKVAFDAPNVPETLMRIVTGEPEPLLPHRRDAPVAFVDLVERAITKDKTRRIMTIEDMRPALKQALEAPPPTVALPRTQTGRINTPMATPRLTPPRQETPTAQSARVTPTSQSVPLLPRTITPTNVATVATGPRAVVSTSGPLMPRPETPKPYAAEGTTLSAAPRSNLWTIGILAAVLITAINVVIALVL
jgi:serine/threonine-protein kinase